MSSVPVEGPPGLPRAVGRRASGRGFTIVAAAVTAALLVTVGLVVLESPRGAPRATGAITFYSARSVARSALGPGNWSLVSVLGVDLWNGTSLPISETNPFPAGCNLTTYPAPSPSVLALPAYQGSLSGGTAVAWILGYLDAANSSETGLLVINGEVAFSATYRGTACPMPSGGTPMIPSNVVDSSAAARSIDAAGGSAFLAGNRTGISLAMILFPTVGPTSPPPVPFWQFQFTPCGGLMSGNQSGPTNGTALTGTVDALSGVVLNDVVPQAVDCVPTTNTTSPPAIYNAITFGPATVEIGPGTGGSLASQGCASGDFCYALSVGQAQMNVTPNDMALWLTNNSGVPSLVPRGFAFLDSQGNVLVYSVGAIENTWTASGGSGATLLVAGDTLEVDMGPSDPSGIGYWLNIGGSGPFSGSVEEIYLS